MLKIHFDPDEVIKHLRAVLCDLDLHVDHANHIDEAQLRRLLPSIVLILETQPFEVAPEIKRALSEAREIAMTHTVKARIPECGHFGEIAQDLDYAFTHLIERNTAPLKAPSKLHLQHSQEALDMALLIAAEKGNVRFVEHCLQRGAKIDARKSEENALMQAAWRGHLDVVNCLIRAGASVKPNDQDTRHTLSIAAFQGHAKVVERLIEAGADFMPDEQYDPILTAATKGRIEVIEVFIKKGLDEDHPSIEAGASKSAITQAWMESRKLDRHLKRTSSEVNANHSSALKRGISL